MRKIFLGILIGITVMSFIILGYLLYSFVAILEVL